MITVKLISIRLIKFNLDYWHNIKILCDLYDDILCSDDWWHFFREGRWSLLRVDETYAADVTKFLLESDIEIDIDGEWIDNIETTRKFQNEFMYAFHAFSELSIKLFKDLAQISESPAYEGHYDEAEDILYKDFLGMVDRVMHAFLNMSRHPVWIKRLEKFVGFKNNGPVYWEPLITSMCANWRAFTIGSFYRGE